MFYISGFSRRDSLYQYQHVLHLWFFEKRFFVSISTCFTSLVFREEILCININMFYISGFSRRDSLYQCQHVLHLWFFEKRFFVSISTCFTSLFVRSEKTEQTLRQYLFYLICQIPYLNCMDKPLLIVFFNKSLLLSILCTRRVHNIFGSSPTTL